MIDIPAALSYLDNLWVSEVDGWSNATLVPLRDPYLNPQGNDKLALPPSDGRIVGAFKEATSIPVFYQNDNTVARLVMRKYNPARAKNMDEGILNLGWNQGTQSAYFIDDGKGFIDPRWCILYEDVEHFAPPSQVLPDNLRYADLLGLQYLYQYLRPSDDGPNLNMTFGILNKMYGLQVPGFMTDMATPKEAHTIYKLLLFGMCALRHNHMALVKQLLDTVSQFQITMDNQDTIFNWREDEVGGIKTEWFPPELTDYYHNPPPEGRGLLVLSNCETVSLAIMLQNEYNWRTMSDSLMVAGGVGAGAIGASSLFFSKKQARTHV